MQEPWQHRPAPPLEHVLAREQVLERLVGRALAADPAEPLPSSALRLLLARYAAGREDLADALGSSLAVWLDASASATVPVESLAANLRLALDAGALSTDTRIDVEVTRLIQALRTEWARAGRTVEEALSGVEACLLASDRDRAELFVATIDELERVVGASYRPGAGISHRMGDPERGTLADHASAASALLAAYERTGRLPYSMLAEELMRAAYADQHSAAPDVTGIATIATAANFGALCRAASVFCRLAVLHADTEYRAAAVFAADADYAAEARSIAARLGEAYSEQNLATAAEYGLLLSDWANLQ